jgi:hypothetical protein
MRAEMTLEEVNELIDKLEKELSDAKLERMMLEDQERKKQIMNDLRMWFKETDNAG